MHTYEWDISIPGALRALKTQFTTPTTFLSELMQNARRASASSIQFDWEPDSGIMAVCDDGGGIQDFGVLFVGCESGEDPPLDDQERPIGISLMSAILASDFVEIHSLDQRTSFQCQDPFQRRPVNVYTAARRAGTEFRLHLRQDLCLDSAGWSCTLQALARGFPIRVYFNGLELPRPHALDQGLPFRQTPIGQLRLEGLEACRPRPWMMPTLYYQGLPLEVRSRTVDPMSVLHADTARFKARSPDRATLHDSDRNEAMIVQSILEMWQERLLLRQYELTPQEFVDQHWKDCKWLRVPALLRNMPLSASMLSKRVAPITLVEPDRNTCEDWGTHSLPDRNSLLVWDVDVSRTSKGNLCGTRCEALAPLACVYAIARGLPILNDAVPSSHWATEQAIDLLDENFGLTYEPQGAQRSLPFDIQAIALTVLICESYTIYFKPLQTCKVSSELREQLTPVRVTHMPFYDSRNLRIVVPADCHEPENILGQVAPYEDSDGIFQERAFVEDRDALETFIMGLRVNAPGQYLQQLLRKVQPSRELLGDQKFQVSYHIEEGWRVHAVDAGNCP